MKATTGDTFDCTDWQTEDLYHDNLQRLSPDYKYPLLSRSAKKLPESLLCKDLTWAHDGSSVVSVHEDFGVRVYTMPSNLGAEDELEPDLLVALSRTFAANLIISHLVHPDFSLYDNQAYETGANVMLLAERQLPIKLVSLIPGESLVASYHFKDDENDCYYDSHSLLFLSSRTFACGLANCIGFFDIARNKPVSTKKPRKVGIVSAISSSKTDSSIFCGSYLNNLTVFDSTSLEIIEQKNLLGGDGIYQILESDNGNFIYPLSRRANEIPILDKRMGYAIVDTLTGWHADASNNTQQKMFGDTIERNQGLLVGNQNSQILLWKDCAIGMGGLPEILTREPIEPPSPPTTIGSVKHLHGFVAACQGSRGSSLHHKAPCCITVDRLA